MEVIHICCKAAQAEEAGHESAVGETEEETVQHYHKNPRQITKRQLTDLERSLAEFGDLSGIVHNLPTDEIIGGNQRGVVFDLIAHPEAIVITEQLDEPDAQGTIARGHVDWNGHQYVYRAVVWDERQAEQANVQANKLGGSWDFDVLADRFEVDDLLEWGFEPFELGISDEEAPEFAEYDESAADDVEMIECPECGHSFPK